MTKDEIVIELKGVEKTFRDFWLRPLAKAVRGLDLEVMRGDVFGLIGPNGSGKSTTIKMILGLVRPTKGSVRLFGLDPRAKAARSRIGYLPELSRLHPFLTAEETVMYYAGLSGMKRADAKRRTSELLDELDLARVAKRTVGGFSKGMARRVAIAAALVASRTVSSPAKAESSPAAWSARNIAYTCTPTITMGTQRKLPNSAPENAVTRAP